jgi:very-short-patch-repair endonuclease
MSIDAKLLEIAKQALIEGEDAGDFVLLRRKCESPIEELMAVALGLSRWCDGGVQFNLHPSFKHQQSLCECDEWGNRLFRLAAQVEVAGYRLDFLLSRVISGGRVVHVAIECDGHEFHEKTKEQAARDKLRDRELIARGITVLRFTGSEIWRDAARCAREAFEILNDADHEAAWLRIKEAQAHREMN